MNVTTVNPWEFVTASGEPIPGNYAFAGHQQPAVSTSGEINASSLKDALQMVDKLMRSQSSGAIQKKRTLSADQQRERRMILASAYSDPTGKQWAMLGANMADTIKAQAEKEGFMRRLLNGNTLEMGQDPRVPMHESEAVAVVATSAAAVEYQLVRTKMFRPPEFQLVANLMVENVEIQQVSGDTLERAYNDGVEAIMVQEDRLWKRAADATAGIDNPITYIGGQLTPSTLSAVRSGVANWGLPVTNLLLASNLWDDIVGNTDFHTLFSEIAKYDLVLNGQIGTILGMEIITDAFRNPRQKVLNKGELYAVSSPEFHGGYTDRGGVVSTPIDGAQQGLTSRGWFLSELMSLVITNPRSCSIGRRL